MDKITGFLPGIVKIPTSVQISRFTTTWLSSGFHYSSQFSKIPLILREFLQQKQTWRPPRSSSGHAYKKVITGILQQTISGTQTHETVATSNRLKYVKQPFTCTNFQSGNSRIYQEVDSTGGVGHLDRPHSLLFSCSNSPTISKISEISNKKRGFSNFRLSLLVSQQLPRVYLHCEEVKLITQARNLRIHQYLDDWLLRSPTKDQCLKV